MTNQENAAHRLEEPPEAVISGKSMPSEETQEDDDE